MFIRFVAAAAGVTAVIVNTASTAAAVIDSATGLDEVVITAQRREESAQNVGIAMSVLLGRH